MRRCPVRRRGDPDGHVLELLPAAATVELRSRADRTRGSSGTGISPPETDGSAPTSTAARCPPGYHEGLRVSASSTRLSLRRFQILKYSVEDVIAQGDKVVVRWKWLATHTGQFRGLLPTGRRASLTGIAICKVVEGKVVQRWVEGNVLGLLLDLGTEVRTSKIPRVKCR